MFTVLHCKECKKEGSLLFILSWEYKTEWCKKCNHFDTQTRRFYFCSEKCLGKWVKKFVDHKHQWIKHPMTCVQLDGSYCELCDICEETRIVNVKDKSKKEVQKL